MQHELTQQGRSYLHLQPLMDEILDARYTDLGRDLELCQDLLRLSEAEDYHYGRVFALTYLGDYYIARNNGHLAGEYLQKASELLQGKQYTELEMNLHIFFGIYYDMLLDQFMSLTHTLEALDYASQLGNSYRMSVIYNNIANMFETFGDMEASKLYYYESYRCLSGRRPEPKDMGHYALLIANLIHLSCISGEVEKAEKFLKEFDYVDLAVNDHLGQYVLSRGHLAAAKQDAEGIRSCADRLLILLQDRSMWGYQFFEILAHFAKFTLDLGEKEYAYRVLVGLDSLTGEDEPGNQLRAQKHWVRYYEMYGTDEEQNAAYKRYYQLQEIIDITNRKTMSAGLHAKISLRQATKAQEEILKMTEKLETEAQCDELTQLYNRRSFANLSERMTEDPTITSLGMVMIDVDYFKQYNDTYGHGDGDGVLRAVAEQMIEAAAGNEKIYNFRYGGDEFVCMYENCTEEELERHVAAIVALVRNSAMPHSQSICSDIVTLSVGFHFVRRVDAEPIDMVNLLACADKALYWSKGRGRDGYSKFTLEMESTLSREL